MNYTIDARIELKPGVVDAEGETVKKSLNLLGFPANNVSSVKVYTITIDAANETEALSKVEDACKKLLANPVIQNYTLKVK